MFAAAAVRASGVVEGGTQCRQGLSLEVESDEGVDSGGNADVGGVEKFLDHDEFDSLLQEQGGGMPPDVERSCQAAAESLLEGWAEDPLFTMRRVRRGTDVWVDAAFGASVGPVVALGYQQLGKKNPR